jgi:hypothetical protein
MQMEDAESFNTDDLTLKIKGEARKRANVFAIKRYKQHFDGLRSAGA